MVFNKKYLFIYLFLTWTLVSCGPSGNDKFLKLPPAATENLSDHILIASQLNQSVTLLKPDGSFLREIAIFDGTTADTPFGIGILDDENIAISVDGVDRIAKANLSSGSKTDFIFNANLTGTMGNLTRLINGDILVIETNNVERFTSSGTRIATGGWPLALQTGGSGIEKISAGGFVLCSTTADRIRTYTDAGVGISALTASGIGATTDASDCATAVDGRIAVLWNGTTDTVRIFTDQTLSVVDCNFVNSALLPNPLEIDFRPNGNALIADGTNNIIVEIDSDCNFVDHFSSLAVATPTGMKILP